MSEYLSKEEIKKWRSSVEKITLEEYAARLGKKLQEEKKTNDLADMLYTHFNPAQAPENYNSVTKLEKLDLTPHVALPKNKKSSVKRIEEINANKDMAPKVTEKTSEKELAVKPAKEKPVEVKQVEKASEKETSAKKTSKPKEIIKEEKVSKQKEIKPIATPVKKQPQKTEKNTSNVKYSGLNITFTKSLTDREEKVLAYFIEKKGEIVYAKDLAELLQLKRDYIYKYIKNLRAKMSTDIIANADNGGFKLS